MAITDHRLYFKDENPNRLNGCEYNCYLDLDQRYHFHLLALDNGSSTIPHDDNSYKSLFYNSLNQVQELIDLLKSKNNMVFIAHPKNNLIPLWMLKTLDRYDGIEVFNSKANSDASDYYDELILEKDIKVLAVDDSHTNSDALFFKGYIIIEDDIEPLKAIKSGRYYSSTGVVIDELSVSGNRVEVKSNSDVSIYLYDVNKRYEVIHHPETELSDKILYIRIVCHKEGKKAWSNLITLSQQ